MESTNIVVRMASAEDAMYAAEISDETERSAVAMKYFAEKIEVTVCVQQCCTMASRKTN